MTSLKPDRSVRSSRAQIRSIASSMSHKRKYESDRDHDRNVRTRTTESVLPVPEDAAAETVPQVFQYEEVIMNPDSSRMYSVFTKPEFTLTTLVLAPAPKPIQKKKKPKAPKVQTEPAGDAALFAQSGGMPVAIDPATGLPINVMPAYGYPGAPGYGQQQQYAYSFSAAPVRHSSFIILQLTSESTFCFSPFLNSSL